MRPLIVEDPSPLGLRPSGWNGRPRAAAAGCMPDWAATTRSTWRSPLMTAGATRPPACSTPAASPRKPSRWRRHQSALQAAAARGAGRRLQHCPGPAAGPAAARPPRTGLPGRARRLPAPRRRAERGGRLAGPGPRHRPRPPAAPPTWTGLRRSCGPRTSGGRYPVFYDNDRYGTEHVRDSALPRRTTGSGAPKP